MARRGGLALASTSGAGSQPQPQGSGTDPAFARQLDALSDYLAGPEVEGLMTDRQGRPSVQLDSVGVPTAGYGHKVTPADGLKVGDPVDLNRARDWLKQDASAALTAARAQAAEAGIEDRGFLTALGSVNYQLGSGWRAKFPDAWRRIAAGDYEGAAQAVAQGRAGGPSRWLQQTPKRVDAFQRALRALPPKPGG
jgi:GH24 family phage-related lysozyme (muramidase)